MSENQVLDPEKKDAEDNKVVALIAYIPFLFLVPLLAAKDSKFAMFHANQGLVLLLTSAVLNVACAIIPIIGWILAPLVNLLVFILMILGIINASQGEKKELPVIGSIHLLK